MSKWSRYLDDIRFAITDMQANRLRTILSLTGVTIGIFCIVMVKTVIDSLSANISDSLSTLGSDVVYVGRFAWVPEDREGEYPFWKYLARPGNTFFEYQTLRDELHNVDAISILYNGNSQNVSYRGTQLEAASIYGVTEDFDRIQNFNLGRGRYFNTKELEGLTPSTVLGYEIAETIGNGKDMLNEYVHIDNSSMKVIGILKKQAQNNAGFNFDQAIMISYPQASRLYNFEGNTINNFSDPLIMIKAKDVKYLSDVEENAAAILRRMRQLKPTEENNFSFNRLSEIQKLVDSIFISINIGGFLIGIFALIIGIFGIANIMFVAVKERTPQIGLLKALGAKRIDILIEFIAESIMLCLIGGLIGLFLIYILSYVISEYSTFKVFLSTSNFLLGMGISLLAGFLAGIIPANSAARMKPVDAIRYS